MSEEKKNPPFCIDCRHLRIKRRLFGFKEAEWLCERILERDVVTGRPTEIYRSGARRERMFFGACGPEGKHFVRDFTF